MRLLHARKLIFLTLLLVVATSEVSDSWAQQVINVEQADVTGTLLRASPLGATIDTPLGAYDVDLVNREFTDLEPARIEVKGEKPRDFLRPGLTVRFEAEIEHRGTIREPLAELTVIDPTDVVAMWDAGDAEAEPRKELIVARVRTIRRDVLSLEVAGDRKPQIVQAKLANNAVIKISARNLSAAMPGDEVHVKGWQEVGGRLKRIWAEEFTVTSLNKPAGARAAGGEARPEGARRAFGDVAPEKNPSSKDAKYKGVILEIN